MRSEKACHLSGRSSWLLFHQDCNQAQYAFDSSSACRGNLVWDWGSLPRLKVQREGSDDVHCSCVGKSAFHLASDLNYLICVYISACWVLDHSPNMFLDEIQDQLFHQHGIDISIATISCTLKRLGISSKKVCNDAPQTSNPFHNHAFSFPKLQRNVAKKPGINFTGKLAKSL